MYVEIHVQNSIIIFCCFAEQVTLISQTEAPDSNITDAQANEVRFSMCIMILSFQEKKNVYLHPCGDVQVCPTKVAILVEQNKTKQH